MSGKKGAGDSEITPAVRARKRPQPLSVDEPELKALAKEIVSRARAFKKPVAYFTERLLRFLDEVHRPARQFTPGDVIDALEAANGLRGKAAQILGCHVGTIDEYRERYPEVEAAVQTQRSLLVAAAASTLVENVVERKDTTASIYLLNNLGKAEGYASPTKHELTGKDGVPLVPTPPPSVRVVIEGGPQEVDRLPDEGKK